MTTRKALGRGLDALLPSATAGPAPAPAAVPEAAASAHVPDTVPVADIAPNPDQPRRHFDPQALESLAESIRRHGLLQPLVVRRRGAGFELLAGERRWRAAQRAGLAEVPIVVREASGAQERLELALIENIQREDLTPLEEAEAYRQLIETHGLTQDDIARQVGKSRPAIANALRLLALPDAVKAQLESGELSAGHARAVLQLDGAEAQTSFAREIVFAKVPKREAERMAATRRRTPARTARAARGAAGADPHWKALADELTRALGTRVRLSQRANGGSIEIEFYSLDQLDGLVARLRAEPHTAGSPVF